jgi:hypothetical protein
MSRKMRTLAAAAAALAATVSGIGSAAEGAGASAGQATARACERQFDRTVEAYVNTTHARDVEGFAETLHPDVTVVFAGGDVLYGKAQTMGFIREFFADPRWTQTFEELTSVVRGCRTGFVLFDSVYTPAPGVEPKPLVIGVTFLREHGRWLALHNQDSNGPAVGEK